MKTYAYPAVFEPGDTPGIVVVTFPDLPEVITEGDGETDARAMASDAMGLVLLTYLQRGRPLPPASEGFPLIMPDAEVSMKIAVIEAFPESGISPDELVRRMRGPHKKTPPVIPAPRYPGKPPMLSAQEGFTFRSVARNRRDEEEARNILDPMHPTEMSTLSAALAVLERRSRD